MPLKHCTKNNREKQTIVIDCEIEKTNMDPESITCSERSLQKNIGLRNGTGII